MITCAACGRDIGEDFVFCPYCATPIGAAPPSREQRKRVTVLFCDLTGSTALGERTDPESLRALLARYFERMKGIIEAHGGTVEKFVGDAVMAVFGVPVLHEDDALRAVRAGLEMQAALPEIGVLARIGIQSGEVVTGTQERLATGDAVNVAARLEQSAQPGEVLIGEETLGLVRGAVEVEAVGALELKGKGERVRAWRLVSIMETGERADRAPMIGREHELDRLRLGFAQAVEDSSCQLFTILGVAGVGKSRLAREFLSGVGGARVALGRCLSYGEGITYWPVVEILKQLDVLPADDYAAAVLRSLLGEAATATSPEDIVWAFRKLLEEQAQEQPLVVVFDDIHCGEETFLDLIESISDISRDAPILLLCMARPELLEKRPSWGGGKWNSTTVLLEPLNAGETNQLLDALGGVNEGLRGRIRTAAEGNPLFVEEMLALLHETGEEEIVVPPTIQALLAARLDQLAPEERRVLECGAVEGRVFHRSAVRVLAEENGNLQGRLVGLVRKELVRPDRSQHAGDEAYRFRHLLIRDAAYDALPKAVRATLHERFAGWLQEQETALVEQDEIVGHHLEQAARYKQELGQSDSALAVRAGERLGIAGRHAMWRGDNRAAKGLMARALTLIRPLRLDVYLELDMADLQPTEAEALAVVEAAAERARAEGDQCAEAMARAAAARREVLTGTGTTIDEQEALAREAIRLLEEAADQEGLVRAWEVLGGTAMYRGRYDDYARACEQAIEYAHEIGHPGTLELAGALVFGSRPADEALVTLDRLLVNEPHPWARLERAELLAMLGRFEEAWATANEASRQLLERTGDEGGEQLLGRVAVLTGDDEAAVGYFEVDCHRLQSRKQLAVLSSYAPMLGRSLCALGRYDEAEPWAQLGRSVGDEDDILTQALWRQVQALVLTARGEHAEAERLGREAVAAAEQTDSLNKQGDALCDLAEVLERAGRAQEAAALLEQALERFGRKRNLAMAARVRQRLGRDSEHRSRDNVGATGDAANLSRGGRRAS